MSDKHIPRMKAFLTEWNKSGRTPIHKTLAWLMLQELDGKLPDLHYADRVHAAFLAVIRVLDGGGEITDQHLIRAADASQRQIERNQAKHGGQYRDQTKGRDSKAAGYVQSMGELNDSSPELTANATWSADPVQQMEIEEAIAERIPQLSVAKQSMVKKWIRGDRYAGERTHWRRLKDFLENYRDNAITPETQAIAHELLTEIGASAAGYSVCEALLAKCNFISELNFAPLERTFHQHIAQEST
jgi:hypothetical protein